MKKQKRFILGSIAVFFYFIMPQYVFALPPVITLQPFPKTYLAIDPSTYYAYNEDVMYQGNWVLPLNYRAIIKYMRDGVVLPHTSTICNFGLCEFPGTTVGSFFWNASSTITSNWNLPFDQTPGIHTAQLQILAQPMCLALGICPLCTGGPGVPVGCEVNTSQITNPTQYYITPAPAPVLNVTPPSLSFSVTEGDSVDKIFIVANTGGAPMAGAVSITGGGGNFTCVPTCTSYVINPGMSASTMIHFQPPLGSGGSSFLASVKFTCSNCTPATSMTRSVNGDSIADTPPVIALYKGGTSTPLPSPLDFGTVSLGSTKDISVRVKNIGGSNPADLAGKITIPSGQYSCIANTCDAGCNYSALSGGQTCDITVRFQPTVTGTDNPTATFSNTPLEPPLGAGKVLHPFTGFGNDKPILEVRGVPTFQEFCSGPTGNINPTSCDMTTGTSFVNVGDPPKFISFDVRNVGTASMNGAFSITPSPDFKCFGGCLPYSGIANGDAPYIITIKFEPVAGGNCEDPLVSCSVTLKFTNPLGVAPPITVTLTANGNNGAFFTTSSTDYTFGDVLTYDTKQQKIMTINNIGVGDIDVDISNTNSTFYCATVADCSFTIPQGLSKNVNFKFSPTTPTTPPAWSNHSKKIKLKIGSTQVEPTLSGRAITPDISVNPSTLMDFGVVNLGANSTRTYSVFNSSLYQNSGIGGSNDVLITVVDSPHYTCISANGVPMSPCSFTLPFGATKPVVIKFEPGTDTGTISGPSEAIEFKYESVPFPALQDSVFRNVTGFGNDQPYLGVTPLVSTDFGTVDVTTIGDGQNRVFEVKNIGYGPASLSGSVSGLGLPFTCVVGCGPYTLFAGQKANITLRFAPNSDGYQTKTINFNGGAGPIVPLTLSGTGNLVRNASILPGSYLFPTINVGDPPPVKTVTLTNSGLGDWRGEVSVELPFKCQPSIGLRCIYTVPAGSSIPIDISFAPSAAGSYNSRIGFSGRTNPAVYFPFDKEDNLGSNTMRDASGNKNDGVLQNGAKITPVGGGNFGEALSVNGANQYVSSFGTSIASGNKISVSAWVYPTGYPDTTYNGVVSFGTRACGDGKTFVLGVQNNGRPSFANWCNDFTPGSGPILNFGQWNHLVAVLDGKNVTLYVNDVSVGGPLSNQTITPNIQASGKLAIGCTDWPGRCWQGMIDEVEIFNRAITPAEVSKLALSSDKSKNFNQSLLAKLRRMIADNAQAMGETSPDKLSLTVNADATFNPLINLDIGAYNFGKVRVNKFKDQVFQFTNTGAGTLGPGTLSVAPPFKCLQTESSPVDGGTVYPLTCDYNVSAGSYFQATIRFAPTTKGIFSKDLIFSTPPGLIQVPLQGEGVFPFVRFEEF